MVSAPIGRWAVADGKLVGLVDAIVTDQQGVTHYNNRVIVVAR